MVVAVVCLAAIAAVAVPFWTRGRAATTLIATANGSAPTRAAEPAPKGNPTLKVMTLNVAHGRRKSLHQALQKRAKIEANLDAIAKVLKREGPHVVALQEADGPSIWSGRFDHVEYLAGNAGFSHHCRGEHVKGMKLSYGTALLSRLELKDCRSVTFAPSPPTLSKGFVVGTIQWPGRPGLQVDCVSVHLDFSRKSVRRKQVRKMITELAERENPLIIMGDFNCEWTGRDRSLRTLAKELDVVAYKPTAEDMPTFPKLKKRLDWLLVSPELEFVEYKTVPDAVSDHRGVVAVLRIVDQKDVPEP